MAIYDRNATDHRADRRALNKSGDRRAEKKALVPQSVRTTAVAELECDAAENQPEQKQQHGDVKSRQKDGVDDRESGEQRRADHHEPSLVAVPEWGDRVHHLCAERHIPGGPEQDPHAQIEAVKDHVQDDGPGDDRGPEQRERGGFHGDQPSAPGVDCIATAGTAGERGHRAHPPPLRPARRVASDRCSRMPNE